DADAAIAAFLDFAEGVVLLPMLPSEGAFAAALSRMLARRGGASMGFGAHQRALLAPHEDRAGYLERNVPHKKLQEPRGQRRRLPDTGAVEFVTAREDADVTAAFGDFLILEASGWKGRQGSAASAHAPIRDFMGTALTALAAEGNARVDR